MIEWLLPRREVEARHVAQGMRLLLYDGAMSHVLMVFTTGAFLIGFALNLGASNTVIGVLAAVGPMSQIIQIPTIFLVERLRLRKAITLATAFVSRLMWVFIAVIPWTLPQRYQIPAFVGCLFVHFGLAAVAGCSFNSWVKDLIPESIMGSFFGRRLAYATFAGALLSLAAAIGIDYYREAYGEPLGAYTLLFLIASGVGVTGLVFLGSVAEPRMANIQTSGVREVLSEPWRDKNFRQLLIFLGFWNFAVNFAAPFFGVYLLRELGMSMSWVLGLSVLSQLVNVLFFSLWGRLADRFSNKSVLAVSGPLFIFSFILWPFTTMPDQHFLTAPLLILIHILAGISTAGVTLCAGNIALKAAPYGKATAYLATSALVSGIAATCAPILAGFAADFFTPYELTMSISLLNWYADELQFDVPTVDVKGLDFIFVIAFLLGLQATHRLLAVREEGEVREAVVRQALLGEMRKVVRQVSTVAGMRQITSFPYSMLETFARRRPPAEEVEK